MEAKTIRTPRMDIDAVRLNVMLIALLAAASAINGIIVYSYL